MAMFEYKFLNNKTKDEATIKLLEFLSKEKLTPIDITEMKIDDIEIKHFSYLFASMEFKYHFNVQIGNDRKVYVDKVVKSVNPIDNSVQWKNVQEYSHTVTDWNNYSNNGYMTLSDTTYINQHINDNNIVELMFDKVKEKIEFNKLKQNPNIQINNISNFTDIDTEINSLSNRIVDRLENKLKNNLPGDRQQNFNYDTDIIDNLVVIYHLPVYCLYYTYNDKQYNAYYCDAIDQIIFNFPIDNDLQEVNNNIQTNTALSTFMIFVINIALTFFFWNDRFWHDIMWYVYGGSLLIILKNGWIKLTNDAKQFKPIFEEKERRLKFKLSKLFPQ